jgi:hypothetical protein
VSALPGRVPDLLTVAPLVFPAAAAGTFLVAANFTAGLLLDSPLLFALGAGAGSGMFREPVSSYHASPL